MKSKEDKIIDLLSRQFFLKAKYPDNGRNYSMRGYGLLPELELENVEETERPRLLKEFSLCKAQLEQSSDAEIDNLWNELQEQKKQESLKEIESQKQSREQNLFFNRPAAKADYDYWSKMPYLTIEEAAALMLGKCPKKVNYETIENYINQHPFAKKYMDTLEIIERALSARELIHESVHNHYGNILETRIMPCDLVNWAKRKGIEVPGELESEIRAQSERNQDWEALYKEKFLENQELQEQIKKLTGELEKATSLPHAKEKDSILKMIAGMAAEKYGYILEKRNTAAKDIVDNLKKHRIDIDEGTVRKNLQAAGNNWLRKKFDD